MTRRPSRVRILEAATAIASELGYDGATISKISKEATVPSSSIYWHFGDKDGLMTAVIDHCFQLWSEAFPRWDALPLPPVKLTDALRTLLQAHVAASEAAGDFFRIGQLLLLETRDTRSLARERIIEIRKSILDETESWLAAFLSPTAPSTLARDLAQIVTAAIDGVFLSRQRGDSWEDHLVIDVVVNAAAVAMRDAQAAAN